MTSKKAAFRKVVLLVDQDYENPTPVAPSHAVDDGLPILPIRGPSQGVLRGDNGTAAFGNHREAADHR